jgi:hypothetical protein
MADINAVAQQFTDFYYNTFDSDRSGLGALYVRRHFFLFPLRFLGASGVSCVWCGSDDIDLLMLIFPPYFPPTLARHIDAYI